MARVNVLQETSLNETPDLTQWTIWFQWCRYIYDDNQDPEYGYRFIWRRPDGDGGGLQAARGQARIPSVAILEKLVAKAKKAGWAHYDGDNYPNPFVMLWAMVDEALNPQSPAADRKIHIRTFIEAAAFGNRSVYDFERAIGDINPGKSYSRGSVFKNARQLCEELDEGEREQLRNHFLEKVRDIEGEFPDLAQEFPMQFSKPIEGASNK